LTKARQIRQFVRIRIRTTPAKEEIAMRTVRNGALVVLAVLSLAACESPGKGKPQAEVGKAATPPPPAATPAPAAETVAINPQNAKIEFVGAKVTGKHDGGFRNFSGAISLSPTGPQASRIALDIDMTSIWSDNEKLTGHLKSPDFFEIEKYPKATFTSTQIAAAPEGGSKYMVTGNLEMHGVTKAITFPATIEVAPAQVTANAEFVLKRKDFNVSYPGAPDDLISDDVLLKLAVTAPRAAAHG
jgi:polyisoprenoid-binding protein YceI